MSALRGSSRMRLIAVMTAALTLIGSLAASCAQNGASTDASMSSPAASPSGSNESSSAGPDTASASAPASPSATSDANPSRDANDPGDGVARDTPAPAPSQTSADGREEVDVVLTRWSSARPFEAGGMITNITENDGTCTLTVSNDQKSLTASGHGAAAPSGVNCGDGLRIDDAALTPGQWQVSLSYSSPRYVGSSPAQEVTLS